MENMNILLWRGGLCNCVDGFLVKLTPCKPWKQWKLGLGVKLFLCLDEELATICVVAHLLNVKRKLHWVTFYVFFSQIIYSTYLSFGGLENIGH